jgi:rubrerythrin
MRQSARQGENRTGIVSAPERAEAMVGATAEFLPSSEGSARAIGEVRVAYAQEGETLGEVPPPAGLVDKAKSAMSALAGGQPTLLMDKLGERLAFEHAGARLYEALLSKHHPDGSFTGAPAEQDLLHILQEEYEHADMLERAIKDLGGDPTALTPSANLAATISAGLPQVLTDPRTNLLQSLEAIVVAELADNECWTTLEALALQAGLDELAASCREAIEHERDHLMHVRQWIAAGHGHEMAEGAPLPGGGAEGEEFTFTEASGADREGFVVSEEEQREREAASERPKRGRSGKKT